MGHKTLRLFAEHRSRSLIGIRDGTEAVGIRNNPGLFDAGNIVALHGRTVEQATTWPAIGTAGFHVSFDIDLRDRQRQ